MDERAVKGCWGCVWKPGFLEEFPSRHCHPIKHQKLKMFKTQGVSSWNLANHIANSIANVFVKPNSYGVNKVATNIVYKNVESFAHSKITWLQICLGRTARGNTRGVALYTIASLDVQCCKRNDLHRWERICKPFCKQCPNNQYRKHWCKQCIKQYSLP